jgi:predicted PurR-regulated permease PerM
MQSKPAFCTERKIILWLGMMLAFFLFLYLIRGILLPFMVGILVAYFLDPAADRLEKAGLGRGAATATITIGFFSILALGLALLAPMLAGQIMDLLAKLPSYYNNLRQWLDNYVASVPLLQNLPVDITGRHPEQFSQFSGKIVETGQRFVMGMLQSGLVFMNLISLLVITPVVAFYLLRDWDRLTAKIDALLPRQSAAVIRQQLAAIDDTMAGFIRGQSNVMLILGIYYAIGLSLAGLASGALIGFVAGLLIIIPYIGTFIGGCLAVGVAFAQFPDFLHVAVVGAIFVLGQMLEGYYLTPKLVGSKVGLHPVWIIFGMLAGGALFGFVGILLAVPVTAVIGVLMRFAVEQYLKSPLYGEA